LPALWPAAIPPAQRRLRILLAEDNQVNQKLVGVLLRRDGHDVFVANNGREAVDAARQLVFDVVLMDVQMPLMDGFAATAAIRETERENGRHTPIVALTAHAMKGDAEKCLAAGMDAYLSKPILLPALRETLARLAAVDDGAAAGAVLNAPGITPELNVVLTP
jgi:CheY-like chemotaxis protein